MKKVFNKIKEGINNAFYWLAQKYLSFPMYLQWIALGIIGLPAIASFLIIWFSLGSVMDENSFLRWLLAVIPAFSILMGAVIGMSYATPPVIKPEDKEENKEEK